METHQFYQLFKLDSWDHHLSVCFGTEYVCLVVRGVILVPQCESYW